MKNITISLFMTLFLSFPVNSTELNNASYKDLITSQFIKYHRNTVEEKVYLHTDKPYYSAGENIWFRAYLVNASDNKQTAYSKYLYVELLNRLDSVIYRTKLKKDSTGFSGYFKLKPNLASGDYNIRAYTHWMQNSATEFFFNKKIVVGNRIDNSVNSKTTFALRKDGMVDVKMKFTDESFQAITDKRFQITLGSTGRARKKMTQTSTSDGTVIFSVPYDTVDIKSNVLNVSLIDASLKYNANVFLPDFSKNYDLQFFPESGTLLDNGLQTVAFKAIGFNGLSLKVSGMIYSSKGEELCDIETLFNGLGKVTFVTTPGEKYYAIVRSESGLEKRFDLPATHSEGVVLHVLNSRNRIIYELIPNSYMGKLFLLIHTKGNPILHFPVNKNLGVINDSIFDAGISTISVIDSVGNTLCERLFFKLPTKVPVINLTTDKAHYSKREEVKLNFNISTLSMPESGGNYSVSITDNHFVKLDSLGDNIVSNLLLCSDLKGYIENPGSYFINDKIPALQKLDLLMMTQGWRRYNTTEILKGNFKKPTYYLELGQTLSGKVLNLIGKPAKKCNIYAFSKNSYKYTVTDSLGNYVIDGIEFQDSTTFMLKAQKERKGITDVEIVSDPDIFPKASTYFPPSQPDKDEQAIEYFMQSKNKYYTEGGMRVYNLQELTVTAEKKDINMGTEFYSGTGDSQISSEVLDKYQGMSVLTVLSTIAGVSVSGDQISIRGSSESPTIFIDGLEMFETSELSMLMVNDIQNIEVFKGANAAIFGSRGGNGVIAIALKTGVTINSIPQVSLASIMPLGIQKPETFYIPKYEVDSILNDPKQDLRTTIYWNPLLVPDVNGNIHLKFFTADEMNDYSIVLEGITKNGELCRYIAKLKR